METNEVVSIKKVLQDRGYKNRELHITCLLDNPNVVKLKHFFFSTIDKHEVYLNLVQEYVSKMVYKVKKQYNRLNQYMHVLHVHLYTYQIYRVVSYLYWCYRSVSPYYQAIKLVGESLHSSAKDL